ncbi:MAG: ketoacyl-ACP synthase III [Alphaproteobacteria bacterium]|jgi:3-oxoacyl-[acyl-carrier-protein] synthase-3|nr:ketoacyl-ACP synthase III [Alphaproteobacteria bacterium]
MTFHSVVMGTGAYLPKRIVTNHDLAARMDTSHEWIVDRTGIHQRHVAAEKEYTSDLATHAARQALERAGIAPESVDLIVLATTTPDDTFPAAAVTVQEKLRAHHAFAFDVQAVCSGFVYALSVADNYIRSGQVKTALVIGAETMSRLLDPDDRGTAVLFGDGAGALVLQAQEGSSQKGISKQRGILSTHLYSDGRYRDALYVDGGPSRGGAVGYVRMQGREVMKHAVEKIGDSVKKALEFHDLTPQDIDWFVPHQANIRIINAVAKHFGLPAERVVVTVDKHANTSAASIPLALSVAEADGRIVPGQLVVIEAMGGGFTWGSAVIRW